MFAPPTPQQERALLCLIAHAADGVSLDQVITALSLTPEDRRMVKQWLDSYIDGNRIFLFGEGRNAVYLAIDPPALQRDFPLPPPPSATVPQTPVAAAAAANDTPPQPLTAAVANAPAPSDADFPRMLDLAIPMIISAPLHRQPTIVCLRDQAGKNGKVGRGVGAYVNYAMGVLDRLTEADVADYGITAEEYAAWKERFAPPLPPAPPAAAPIAATSPAPSAPHEVVGVTLPARAPTAASPTSAPPPTPEQPATADLLQVADGPDLIALVQKLRFGTLLNVGIKLTQPMLTWQRIGIVLGWALAIRLVLLHQQVTSTAIALAAIPLSGIPWVVIRLRDRLKESKGFNLREATLLLLAGGWVALYAARILVGLGLSLRYMVA
jgi:hypothetical protein